MANVFNVSEFRSRMTGDGARPNLFKVILQPPIVEAGIGERIEFMAKAAQLPGSTIGMVPLNYFGRELKFPGNRTFPDWTITIINDEDFAIRNAMESWMSNLNSHESNVRGKTFTSSGAVAGGGSANAGAGYSRDADVIQYKKEGNVAKTYSFAGMFPIDISPIELDWGTNDSIEEFTVTFAYQYWTTEQLPYA